MRIPAPGNTDSGPATRMPCIHYSPGSGAQGTQGEHGLESSIPWGQGRRIIEAPNAQSAACRWAGRLVPPSPTFSLQSRTPLIQPPVPVRLQPHSVDKALQSVLFWCAGAFPTQKTLNVVQVLHVSQHRAWPVPTPILPCHLSAISKEAPKLGATPRAAHPTARERMGVVAGAGSRYRASAGARTQTQTQPQPQAPLAQARYKVPT
ncbi:hypothetical protein BT67DRAFT_135472 [Trichocladium antarcticum]|uniref:Uncharacterized protein n=1 Tax=Trichocladium antarcticum TaxID=1450529 RepID=A0AAN6ZBG7_9PEZI|nr:hypothetical protein BT67DRAFT_135472 [Trichocladium antarcticum]